MIGDLMTENESGGSFSSENQNRFSVRLPLTQRQEYTFLMNRRVKRLLEENESIRKEMLRIGGEEEGLGSSNPKDTLSYSSSNVKRLNSGTSQTS